MKIRKLEEQLARAQAAVPTGGGGYGSSTGGVGGDSKQMERELANQEKKLPESFIREDGMGITEECRRYLLPLIQGEAYPPYHNHLPDYVQLKNRLLKKKLAAWDE